MDLVVENINDICYLAEQLREAVKDRDIRIGELEEQLEQKDKLIEFLISEITELKDIQNEDLLQRMEIKHGWY